MDSFEQDSEIQISLSGTFNVQGPLADYTQLLKGVCCVIAMDLDRCGNKKTQYFVAVKLFEHIRVFSRNRPNGVLTSLTHLQCKVDVKEFTYYPYMNTLTVMPNRRVDVVKYYIDNNTFVKITYDLTLDLSKYLEIHRKVLMSNGYHGTPRLEIDDILIYFIKLLHEKSSNSPFNLKRLSSYIAENIKTLGGKELLTTPPFIADLYATLETKLNIDLNNVE